MFFPLLLDGDLFSSMQKMVTEVLVFMFASMTKGGSAFDVEGIWLPFNRLSCLLGVVYVSAKVHVTM